MRRIAGILIIGVALLVAGCEEVSFDPFGDDDDTATTTAAVQPNGCTEQGCPQAAQFCQARGYQPGSDGYARCLVSVNENLRRGHGSMAAPGPYPQ
jgi:hypothetical protein